MLRQIQMLKIVLNSINCECHIKGMTLLGLCNSGPQKLNFGHKIHWLGGLSEK